MGGLKNFYFISIFLVLQVDIQFTLCWWIRHCSLFIVQGVFLSPIAGAPSGALSGQSRRWFLTSRKINNKHFQAKFCNWFCGWGRPRRTARRSLTLPRWRWRRLRGRIRQDQAQLWRDCLQLRLEERSLRIRPGKRDPYGYGLGKREPYGYGLGKRAPYGYGLGKRQPYGYGLGKRDPYGYGLGKRQPYGYGLGKRAAFGNEDFGKRDPYGYGLGKRDPYGYGLGKREPYGYGLGKWYSSLWESLVFQAKFKSSQITIIMSPWTCICQHVLKINL